MKKTWLLFVAVLFLFACSSEKALFKEAQLATSKGELSKAMQKYSRLIKKNPQSFAAYANRGILWERLPTKDAKEKEKNRRMAEQDYLAAIAINNKVTEPYNNLGALYLDTGRYSDAIFYLSEAIALNPRYFLALMNRAIAYYRQGRTLDSLADFNSAYKLRNDDPLLFLNRGLVYYNMGNYESAAEDFNAVVSIQPNNARGYLERARALIKMGYPAAAYADLEEAVSISPSYALAYYYMGDLAYRRGETDYALGLLVKSKELASKYVPTYELMGDILSVEDPVAATANYITAKKLDPKNARRYEQKMRLMRTEEGRQRILAARFFPREER